MRDESSPSIGSIRLCYEMTAEVTGFEGSEFSVCSSYSFCVSDVVIGMMTSRICAVVMVIESVLTCVVIGILFFMEDKE